MSFSEQCGKHALIISKQDFCCNLLLFDNEVLVYSAWNDDSSDWKKKKKNHHFMQFQIKCLRIECFQKSKNMLKRSKYHHWTISFQVYYLCTQHSLGLGNQCRGSLNWFFKVDWWCVFILCQTEHSWRPGYWTNPLPHEISNSLSEASTNKCAIWQQGYQMWQSSSDSHSHATVTSQFLDLFEAGAEK